MKERPILFKGEQINGVVTAPDERGFRQLVNAEAV